MSCCCELLLRVVVASCCCCSFPSTGADEKDGILAAMVLSLRQFSLALNFSSLQFLQKCCSEVLSYSKVLPF